MNKNKITLDGNNIKILVCCHKPCELPKDPDGILLPIQVGAAISDADLGMQRDDMADGKPCDNISAKNKSFCELTAMYWAWKNIKKIYSDLEYIGLNHYRRFFSFTEKDRFRVEIVQPEENAVRYTLDKNKLRDILQSGNSVAAKPEISILSVGSFYCNAHISEDLRTLTKIVHEKYPDYDKAMYDVFDCGHKMSACNMFVMPIAQFDSYCAWLFDILFEAERRINISNYNSVQARIFGYMAERLFNVWSARNNMRIKHLNILKFDNENFAGNSRGKLYRKLYGFLAFLRCSALAFLLKPAHRYSPEYYAKLHKLKSNGGGKTEI